MGAFQISTVDGPIKFVEIAPTLGNDVYKRRICRG